jgi:hypothetical protein
MNATTPTMSAEVAALLELCRRTHETEVANVFSRTERLARTMVRRVVFRGCTREDFSDFVAIGCTPMPDESQPVFDARRRGLIAGLIAGASDLAAR